MVTIDLSKFDQGEESKRQLASELLEAIRTKGFFYLINFGISNAAVDRQFGIGNQFYSIPMEERMEALSDLANGNSNGYCPAGRRVVGKDLKGEFRYCFSTYAELAGNEGNSHYLPIWLSRLTSNTPGAELTVS